MTKCRYVQQTWTLRSGTICMHWMMIQAFLLSWTIPLPKAHTCVFGRDWQLMLRMTASQWAVTSHSSKTQSPTSLKGKLCEGGIQFCLPFSYHPPGMQEWKKRDWEEGEAIEIETYGGTMAGHKEIAGKEEYMRYCKAEGGKIEKGHERKRDFLLFTSLHSVSLWQYGAYLLRPLLSQWNGREMGS